MTSLFNPVPSVCKKTTFSSKHPYTPEKEVPNTTAAYPTPPLDTVLYSIIYSVLLFALQCIVSCHVLYSFTLCELVARPVLLTSIRHSTRESHTLRIHQSSYSTSSPLSSSLSLIYLILSSFYSPSLFSPALSCPCPPPYLLASHHIRHP